MPRYVSILTRPGGRVQRGICCRSVGAIAKFQSSPVPEDGCNRWYGAPGGAPQLFQSSPVPEDGCNTISPISAHSTPVSILTRPGGRVQRVLVPTVSRYSKFQSSPVPEDGCNYNKGVNSKQ